MILARAPLPRLWTAESETDLMRRLQKLPLLAPRSALSGPPTSAPGLSGRVQLGEEDGLWADIQSLLEKGKQAAEVAQKAEPYMPTIQAVLEDPALPEVAKRVNKLRQLEQASAAKKGVAPGTPVGIGLKRAIKPLDAYIYVREHPWVPWVAGAGAILLIAGLGFGVGRATSSSPAAGSLGFGEADAQRNTRRHWQRRRYRK